MTWDAENRLLTATNGGGGSYTYDGEGRRVKRVTAGQTWWYVYGINGELLAEYQSGAPTTVRKEYGYRSGQLLVVWDNDKSGNERLKWLVTDHLGSTRMEADLSGSLAGMRRHDYLPFGEELTSAHGAQRSGVGYEPPTSNVRQKFTGKERDGETGLDYFQARYYSSIQGRFTSPDEFSGGPEELYDFADTASDNPTFYADLHDPQSLNKYQYCYNDPLRYVDPDGHSGTLVGALIGAAVGATRAVVEGKTSAKEIGAAAAGGAVAGAMMGSVVDTGGATLVIAGGLAGAAGGMVERMILGEKTNLQDMIADSAGGAIGTMTGVKVLSGQARSKSITQNLEFNKSTKGLGNPFKNKTAEQIDIMFEKKGFGKSGTDPLKGKGGYINPKNGRSYHLDPKEYNKYREENHVDVNRLKGYKGTLDKKKLPYKR